MILFEKKDKVMNKKPIRFLILKILGCLGVALFIFGLVLAIKGFGDFESNNFMIGAFISTFSLVLSVGCLVSGFKPEITKMTIKSSKYIQQENKEELKEIVNTTAEIAKDAVSTTSKAVKDGFTNDKHFCKYCGAQIDSDSIFCNKCGKKQ